MEVAASLKTAEETPQEYQSMQQQTPGKKLLPNADGVFECEDCHMKFPTAKAIGPHRRGCRAAAEKKKASTGEGTTERFVTSTPREGGAEAPGHAPPVLTTLPPEFGLSTPKPRHNLDVSTIESNAEEDLSMIQLEPDGDELQYLHLQQLSQEEDEARGLEQADDEIRGIRKEHEEKELREFKVELAATAPDQQKALLFQKVLKLVPGKFGDTRQKIAKKLVQEWNPPNNNVALECLSPESRMEEEATAIANGFEAEERAAAAEKEERLKSERARIAEMGAKEEGERTESAKKLREKERKEAAYEESLIKRALKVKSSAYLNDSKQISEYGFMSIKTIRNKRGKGHILEKWNEAASQGAALLNGIGGACVTNTNSDFLAKVGRLGLAMVCRRGPADKQERAVEREKVDFDWICASVLNVEPTQWAALVTERSRTYLASGDAAVLGISAEIEGYKEDMILATLRLLDEKDMNELAIKEVLVMQLCGAPCFLSGAKEQMLVPQAGTNAMMPPPAATTSGGKKRNIDKRSPQKDEGSHKKSAASSGASVETTSPPATTSTNPNGTSNAEGVVIGGSPMEVSTEGREETGTNRRLSFSSTGASPPSSGISMDQIEKCVNDCNMKSFSKAGRGLENKLDSQMETKLDFKLDAKLNDIVDKTAEKVGKAVASKFEKAFDAFQGSAENRFTKHENELNGLKTKIERDSEKIWTRIRHIAEKKPELAAEEMKLVQKEAEASIEKMRAAKQALSEAKEEINKGTSIAPTALQGEVNDLRRTLQVNEDRAEANKAVVYGLEGSKEEREQIIKKSADDQAEHNKMTDVWTPVTKNNTNAPVSIVTFRTVAARQP